MYCKCACMHDCICIYTCICIYVCVFICIREYDLEDDWRRKG